MTLVASPAGLPAPEPVGGEAPCGRRRRGWLTSWPASRVFVAVVALIGAAVLLYPTGATWFDDRRHDNAIAAYARTLASTTPAETLRQLEAAHAYNDALPKTELRDPYSSPAANQQDNSTYDGVLAGPDGMLGVVAIPSIKTSLPIYHGVSAHVLDRGVGHLPGSALPVGGPGTHSVLTSHSGVVGKQLFSRLDKVRIGQTFTITVLDQTLTYQVDKIDTVRPDEISTLSPVPGEDYVTLVTCTPIGVNSHRLLVRGHRIPGAEATTSDQIIRTLGQHGFPWWLVLASSAIPAAVVITAPLAKPAAGRPARHGRRRRAGGRQRRGGTGRGRR